MLKYSILILIGRGFVRGGCIFSRNMSSRNMFSRNRFSRNMFSRNKCFQHFVYLEMRVIFINTDFFFKNRPADGGSGEDGADGGGSSGEG